MALNGKIWLKKTVLPIFGVQYVGNVGRIDRKGMQKMK